MRWDGSSRPTIWIVPAPDVDPGAARLELARRYLHVLGPGTGDTFAEWAGIPPSSGRATFEAMAGTLTPVRTAVGDGWILSDDEEAFRGAVERPVAPARLLPSGDTFVLLWGPARELIVANPQHRRELWPSRVWPGAVLVDGRLAGTWRRSGPVVTIHPWRRLSAAARESVEREVRSLPLPDLRRPIRARWET